MTVTDTDLPGGNWDLGPRAERLNGRYRTPAIMHDASSLRGKLGLRAGFIADYLEVESDIFLAAALAKRLRRLSISWGGGDSWVLRRGELEEDMIREHGGRIEEGFRGLWVFVDDLENVKESLEGVTDE